MASKFINVTLKIWRQKNADSKGKIETYQLSTLTGELMDHKPKQPHVSFICEALMMGIPFTLNHGGQKLFQLLKI